MDPTVRSFDSNSSGTATVTVNAPSGLAENDILVAFLMCRDQGVTWTLPSGFTLLNSHVDHGTDTLLAGAIAWKQAGASEPASYDFEQNGSGIGTGCLLVAVQYAAGIEASSIAADNTLNSTADSPDITPAKTNNLLLRGFVAEREGTTTPFIKEPSGYSEVGEYRNAFNRIAIQVSSKLAGSTSATGIVQATTYSNSAETTPFSIYTIGSVVEIAAEEGVAYGQFDSSVEFRGLLNKDFHFAFGRFEVGAEFRGEFYWEAVGRFEVATDFSNEVLLKDHTVRGRFEVGSDFIGMLSKAVHQLVGRFEASLRMKTGYVGRNTGLVIYPPAGAEDDYEYQKFLKQLQEGDEFPGYFPLGGINGKTARVRILSKRMNDSIEIPEFEVQLIEEGDPNILNRLKQDSVIPFIPKKSGNLFHNVIELRKRSKFRDS